MVLSRLAGRCLVRQILKTANLAQLEEITASRLDATSSTARTLLIQPITKLDCGSQTRTFVIGHQQQKPGSPKAINFYINHETFLHLELLPVPTVTVCKHNCIFYKQRMNYKRSQKHESGSKCVNINLSSCITSRDNFYIAITIKIINGHSSCCRFFCINHYLEIIFHVCWIF